MESKKFLIEAQKIAVHNGMVILIKLLRIYICFFVYSIEGTKSVECKINSKKQFEIIYSGR